MLHQSNAAVCAALLRYERVADGCERIIVIVNAARGFWQESNYGVWVGGGGTFEQIYCSQV